MRRETPDESGKLARMHGNLRREMIPTFKKSKPKCRIHTEIRKIRE